MTSNKKLMVAAAAFALVSAPALADPASSAPKTPPSAAARDAAPATTGDVLDVVKADQEFSTFARAVEAAGLTAQLEGAEAKTVFAPTNAAFEALPPGALDDLLKPENRAKLVALLNYHVIPAAATSQQLNGRTVRARTVSGEQLTIDARAGVKVNDAKVVRADLRASNGVVHGVDKVLTPAT